MDQIIFLGKVGTDIVFVTEEMAATFTEQDLARAVEQWKKDKEK